MHINSCSRGVTMKHLITFFSLGSLLVAACASPASTGAPATTAPAAGGQATTAAAPSGTPIKVGVLDDVTGVSSIEGALMRISTELVVQQTNSTGGINGHP